MKIDKLNCCVKSILLIFKILSIYNGSPPLLFFGMSYYSWENTSTNINCSANMKMRNVETITHKFLSKTRRLVHNNTKRFGFIITFSSRRQVSREIQPLWTDFSSLNFRHPLESKGCLKFIQRFPWIDFHRFLYQSIKITWLLAIFVDVDFYLLATSGFN